MFGGLFQSSPARLRPPQKATPNGAGKGQKTSGGKQQQQHQQGSGAGSEEVQPEKLSKKARKRARLQEAKQAAQTGKPAPKPKLNLTPQEKMTQKLRGSRFRWLNELLYTTPGDEAFKLFQKDPELAVQYHAGYTDQRASWPRDPTEETIIWLRQNASKTSRIGDFGCGEARIAQALPKWQVHSFDLVAVNSFVTAANISDVPLADDTLDIAVFCLALMGTDWPKFIAEAGRCLVPGGRLHIDEVSSRFPDTKSFIRSVEQLGFTSISEDASANYFTAFRFMKNKTEAASEGGKKGKKRKMTGSEPATSGVGNTQDNTGGSAAGTQHLSKKARKKAARAATEVVDSGLLTACTYKRR